MASQFEQLGSGAGKGTTDNLYSPQLMDDILHVRGLTEGLTIIIVEHEMGVIERVTNRCVVLNFGSKIAEGTFSEISKDAEVQQAYLGIE